MCEKFGTAWRRGLLPVALGLCWLMAATADAQFFRGGAVGGVKIDVDGVVSNPEVGELKELQAAWQQGLQDVPADLEAFTELRYVSLKRLESQIAAARAAGEPLPDAARLLAGLQRVRYVLIYPEQQDIVLAGPAEGWRVNARGEVVGATTGRPVLALDDLLVALRVAEDANRSGISCSIDPTPEGLQRVNQLPPPGRATRGAQSAEMRGRQLEEALGPQRITVTGVPDTSHFARVIVAADFRMKRLAMDFERAPVDGLPSFLHMAKGRRAGLHNTMPRWWLAADYEPLRRDADGLAWELRGQGVRCMTEQEFLDDAGNKQSTGQADPTAQKWADAFTEKFDELSSEDSAFGALRNVMDLSVVGALLAKERLWERSGLEAPNLMVEHELEAYPAPRRVPSQASFVKAGRSWVISVSGGVQIFPWQVADRTEVADELASARPQESTASAWYWQR
jgi:hypothetical protein